MALPSKCPLCGQKNSKMLSLLTFLDEILKKCFFQCSNCEVIYQYPPLTQTEEIKFYKEEFEGFMNSRSKEETIGSLKDHVNNNKKFLEKKNS